jgi:hypothetical protein
MYEVHVKTIKRFRSKSKNGTAIGRKSKVDRCNSFGRRSNIRFPTRRRKVLAEETTIKLLSKALNCFTKDVHIPVTIYSAYSLETIDLSDSVLAIIDLFQDCDNFPEIDIDSNLDFNKTVTDYFESQFNENVDVQLQISSFDLSIKFLDDQLERFYIIELSEIDLFIQQDSLMALVYLKIISMLQHVYGLFNYGLGTVDYEDLDQLDEMLSEWAYDDTNLTEAQHEEELNKMTASYWNEYIGYPYHYGKIVTLIDNYDLDMDLFLETFKDTEFRYKEMIRLINEISKVQKLDQFAEEYFDAILDVKNIDIEVQDYFVVCYKSNWCDFEDMTPLNNDINCMQSNFEEGNSSGLKINLRLSKTDPFPMQTIQDFIKKANETPYVKLFKQIHDEWNKIFEDKPEIPFTNPIIEDYCKKSNTSIFSWLKSKNTDRSDGGLCQWKSFSDFNTEYPGTQRDWPFNERSD